MTVCIHAYCDIACTKKDINKNLHFKKMYEDVGMGVPKSINPLPTNDAPMRHDLCELSISLWEFIWGARRYTSVHGFCFFSCFLWLVKGYNKVCGWQYATRQVWWRIA